MKTTATLHREGDVAIMRIDNPPVNALSSTLIRQMEDTFNAFEADATFTALLIECAGRTFIAGGDITAFDDPAFSPAPLNTLLDRIEASARPVIAILHGTVLGGGLEVAMATHYRIAAPGTRVGMPEITLGIVPGSLGTQRLPRLAGLSTAFQMISSGKPVGADDALKAGIIDAIDEDPAAAARKAVPGLAAGAKDLRRTSRLAVPDASELPAILAKADALAASKPTQPAYAQIGPCLAAACEDYAKGAAVEAAAFAALVPSAPARALRHVFLAERKAQRIPGLAPTTKLRPITRVGILGVGTMGGGIAMAFANAGFSVTLVETSQEALDRGLGIIAGNYAASVKRGRLTQEEATKRQARMSGHTDMAALADADLIIEAVFEDMALKLDVAAKLGAVRKPGAIIATNTSTLDVDRIALATGCPADVVGTHFFSPAHIMRLLEVVRGRDTAPDVLATVMGIARKIGKTAVVSGVCYGFIGNRMAEVYMRESEAMQLEGAAPADIDGVAEDPAIWGMAMGPSRMLDMAGVDVGARTVIEWIKSGEGPQDPAYRILCRTMFAQGLHGQKTGTGYYRYEGREALPNPAQRELAAGLAAEHGIARSVPPQREEIFERLLFPMVNEAAMILSEGIAMRPSDIDVIWTAGYGLPAWRGGPLFMADEIGLDRIVARMDHYGATLGNDHGYWNVSPLLRQLASKRERISDWTPTGEKA